MCMSDGRIHAALSGFNRSDLSFATSVFRLVTRNSMVRAGWHFVAFASFTQSDHDSRLQFEYNMIEQGNGPGS